jgi:hypothetical protein
VHSGHGKTAVARVFHDGRLDRGIAAFSFPVAS